MFEDTRCTCGLLKSTTRGRKEETERDVCCAARKVTTAANTSNDLVTKSGKRVN